MQNENLTLILETPLFLKVGKKIKRALMMPNLLKIQIEYFEKDENFALHCNYKQIFNKMSTRDA